MQLTVIRSCNHKASPVLNDSWIEVSSDGHVSRARNRGAKLAASEWLLFIDEDCEFLPEQLTKIQNSLSELSVNANCIWGVSYSRQDHGTVWSRAYNWIQRAWIRLSADSKASCPQVENLLGGFLLVHRRVFSDLGGFSEDISWGGEETEFLRRARGKGYEIRLFDEFEIKHLKELDLRGFLRRAWFQGRARGLWGLKTSSISWTEFWRRRGDLDRLALSEFFACLLFWSVMVLASRIATIEKKIHE